MTPLQAAKEHYANYQADGTCLGIAFRDDLSMYRFRKEGLRCLLCDGDRCSYFEEIIVPMRMSRETAEAKARADKKDAAVKTYLNSHNPRKLDEGRVICRLSEWLSRRIRVADHEPADGGRTACRRVNVHDDTGQSCIAGGDFEGAGDESGGG